jgi:type II secretory pathway component GspD/PulD (secretin)
MPSSMGYPNSNMPTGPATSPYNPSSFGTTTGQSKLVATKTIRGEVQAMDPGSGFNDAGSLASTIKIQNTTSTIQNVDVSNNDGGAVVIPDTRTNSILVAGLKEDILLAEQAIACIDKPLPQVSMEVSLIELTKEDNNNLGLGISGHAGFLGSGYNTAANADGSIPAEAAAMVTGADNSALTFSTIRNISDSVSLKLNAEILTNKAKLLANPTVISLDGHESIVKITDQIVSMMTITSQATTGTVVETPTLSDIGIVLNITPKVGGDGYITMKVRPSITTFLKNVTFGTDGYANLISTREVILQGTRVKSGETLAIAGLLQESDIDQMSKLPFAGDLPIFGKLFQNNTKDHTKSEIIILITPKIVGDIATNAPSL